MGVDGQSGCRQASSTCVSRVEALSQCRSGDATSWRVRSSTMPEFPMHLTEHRARSVKRLRRLSLASSAACISLAVQHALSHEHQEVPCQAKCRLVRRLRWRVASQSCRCNLSCIAAAGASLHRTASQPQAAHGAGQEQPKVPPGRAALRVAGII